jgi:uncharacterized protein (DUF885 family)
MRVKSLALAALLAASSLLSLACSGKDARLPWPQVREKYFVGYLKRDPVTATYLGADAYSPELADINAALPDVSRSGRADRKAFYESILADLDRVDPSSLSAADAIDRDVVRAQLRFLKHMMEDARHDLKSIDTYAVAPFRGVDWQIQQMTPLPGGGLGTAQEWERVVRRVRAIPGYLRGAQESLREGIEAGVIPDYRVVQYDGLDATGGHAGYFGESLPGVAAGHLQGQVHRDPVLKDLNEAGREAAAAFRDLGTFLEEAYRPFKDGDRYAAGEAEYEWRLHNNLRLDPQETAASLFAYGGSKVEESQVRLQEVAREVARRRNLRLDWSSPRASLLSVRRVMDDLAREYPRNDEEMFATYRRKALELVEYARLHGMFALPQDYRLEIVETPAMLESTLEAAYYPAPAFKPQGIGRFYLTASHGALGVLKENNIHAVADLCAHEGFPGHDWQYQFMRQKGASIAAVRWLTPGAVEDSSSMWEDSMSAEGWALYAEQLMAEPQTGAPGGFYTPEERLYQLKWQVLRDARVRLDTGLHTGRMSFDDAVAYYLEHVEFLPDACTGNPTDAVRLAACNGARRAIYRYSKWPTQAITYHLGKRDILDLRDRVRALQGDRFSLRSFHERFLAAGTIPAGYFRESLLAESR